MATPFSTSTSADSGFVVAPCSEEQNQHLPPHGLVAGPAGLSKVSAGVLALDEHKNLENDVIPFLEEAEDSPTLSPALQGDSFSSNGRNPAAPGVLGPQSQSVTSNGHPVFSVGEIVSPEEEKNASGSAGTATMVCLEQDYSLQEMKSMLAENKVTIGHLQKELRSSSFMNDQLQHGFLLAKEVHESVLACKNAEIKRLEEEVVKCKLHISNLEKTNNVERMKYKSQIEILENKLKTKEDEKTNMYKSQIEILENELKTKENEISRMKKDRKIKEVEWEKEVAVFDKDKTILKMEILQNKLKISEMETLEQSLRCQLARANEDTAVARRTIAENDAAMVKEENANIKEENTSIKEEYSSMREENTSIKEENTGMKEKLEKKTSEVDVLTERLNSFSSINSSTSEDSSQIS